MSGRKNVLLPIKILSAGDMSAATLTSSVTNIQFLDNLAIQCNFTGSPTGTFAVQFSLDNVNWVSSATVPTAAAGSAASNLTNFTLQGAAYVRVVYTKGSGTGSLDIWICAKAGG